MVDGSPPHVAVIGCGYWGKHLVRNFAALGALRWVCDADGFALAAQRDLPPDVRRTTQLEEVLADPDVKGVVLATPAALHYVQARQVILAGKDVFVEKPLALRYAEGRELVDLALARRSILMVGHILDYHPAVVMLKNIVRSGRLGQVRYIYSTRVNLGRVRQTENILWSFAPHDISVITGLLEEEPTVVTAVGGSYLQNGIADVTVTTFRFNSGVRAHSFVSWLHPYKEQKLVVIGDQQMAVFDDTLEDGKLKIHDKGIEWQTGLPVARQTSETILYHDRREPMHLECKHFLDRIRDRAAPLTDGASALRVLKILEASQLSLEKGGIPIQPAATEDTIDATASLQLEAMR